MCANDIEYRTRIHSLEVQITTTTTMTAVTRAANKNVDDPVTDMNHQTLLYTIFGSLDLLIARHTVPSVPYTLEMFESPAVLWQVWRVEQCEWGTEDGVHLFRMRLLSIYSMMHSGSGRTEGRLPCHFHVRGGRRSERSRNWMEIRD